LNTARRVSLVNINQLIRILIKKSVINS